jgi:sterol desaturase/sphingolipid hydroxylase (fatty acid hydroxylase superfamily)
VFVVLGALGAVFPDTFMAPYVVVSLLEFVFGSVVFALAFLRAVDRSRTEAIGIGGLFFASGSAPTRVQLVLMLSLTAQVVASIAVASVHLYTALAFGVLAPMWSLGFTGLWVAAYGTFPGRAPEPTRTARRDADRRAHRSSSPPRSEPGAE